MRQSTRWKIRRRAAFVGLLGLAAAAAAAGQQAARGRALLDEKGCLACHALVAPEAGKATHLGEAPPELLSPARLAAVLWNHDVFAPSSSGPTPAALTSGQLRDLYAYFDSLRAFDPPGDAVRGKAAFDARCKSCHDGSPGSASPAREWPPLPDLAALAERIWNAAGPMRLALDSAGEPWPRLGVEEAADLTVYLQGLAGGEAAPSAPPSLAAGERVFDEGGCAACHAVGASQDGRIDLGRVLQQQATNGGVAVALANHRPEMERGATERRIRLEPMPPGGLASLLEYLRARGARGVAGNRARGEQTFRLEGCLGCHGIPRSGAPELKGHGRWYDSYSLGGALWRHAERARSVPAQLTPTTGRRELNARQIADITAFLNGE